MTANFEATLRSEELGSFATNFKANEKVMMRFCAMVLPSAARKSGGVWLYSCWR